MSPFASSSAMVSAISSRGPSLSERSEKNTSWRMPSCARSSSIMTSIAASAAARTIGSHCSSGMASRSRAVLIDELLADRLQVVAGIESFGDLADRLAERLAVAQIGRARQRIDLSAGVVDVIFAGDGEAGEGEQIGERVAEHGAAAMADMHRPGRIGRDIFHVHRLALADGALPIRSALLQHHAQHARPEGRAQASG